MDDIMKEMRDMGRNYGTAMRDMAREQAKKRKEDYLGARVPKALRDKVIARAEALDVSVSTLIRRILEEVFSAENANNIGATPTQSEGVRQFPDVLGWDEITLNQTHDCSACSCSIAIGKRVALGISGSGQDRVILCEQCKATI